MPDELFSKYTFFKVIARSTNIAVTGHLPCLQMSEAARTLFEQYMSTLGSEEVRYVVGILLHPAIKHHIYFF